MHTHVCTRARTRTRTHTHTHTHTQEYFQKVVTNLKKKKNGLQ